MKKHSKEKQKHWATVVDFSKIQPGGVPSGDVLAVLSAPHRKKKKTR